MDRLPAEILIHIAEELTEADFLNLRSVCKIINSHLTPWIFSEAEVFYNPASFQNLLCICGSESLCNYITSVKYYGHVYQEVDRLEWMKHIRFPSDVQIPKHPDRDEAALTTELRALDYAEKVLAWAQDYKPSNFYTGAQLNAGFSAYRNAIQQSKSFQQSYNDFTCLVMAIRCLKNLRSMRIETNDGREHYTNKLSRRAALVVDGDLLDLREDEAVKLGIRQLNSVLLSIFTACVKLERLEILSLYWSVLEEQFPKGLDIHAFVRLRNLSLDVSDSSDEFMPEVTDYEKRQTLLAEAIQSAKELEVLKLHFIRSDVHTEERSECQPILWSRLCGDKTWPHLKKLLLSNIDIEAPAFLDFFSRHPQLRSLHLEALYLVDSASWIRTFHRMKKVLTLTTLTLFGKFDCEGTDLPGDNLEEFYDDFENTHLIMEGSLGQLKGRTDSEGVLSDHIKDWFLQDGPSPFLKKFMKAA